MAWSAIQAVGNQDSVLHPPAIIVPHEGLFYEYLVKVSVEGVVVMFNVSVAIAIY